VEPAFGSFSGERSERSFLGDAAVISMGLTTVFGVMGVLNFAHGSLFMLGAYLCMQFVRWAGSFWLGLLLGPPLVAALSVLVERFLLRPLYGRDVSFQLLLTFGVMLFLDDGVRLIWGAAYHVVNPPQILSGVIPFFSQTYPVYRLFLVVLGPLLGIALWGFFAFTRWGKILRAAAMDRQMAEIVGVRVPLLFTAVFAFGAWLAALGGALAAPHQSVGPAMGSGSSSKVSSWWSSAAWAASPARSRGRSSSAS